MKITKINFQPMPKRFMVWDKHTKDFRFNDNDRTTVFDIPALISFFLYQAQDCIPHTNFVLVQSTNLFDKDGEEIFEGNIVDYNDDGNVTGFVTQHDGGWCLEDKNGNEIFLKGAPHQRVIGHILLNPELIKEE